MKPLHVAQYLVNRFGNVPGGITPLKLQKLLYYVKAWAEVEGRGGIVEGRFEKWPHGPVNPPVYRHYRREGYTRQPIQPVDLGPLAPTGEARAFVEFVGASYARFPAVTLSVMTHREDPWRLTADRDVIPVSLMREFYRAQPFAVNLPFDPGAAYRPVQSDLGKAFTMDLSDADEARATTFDTFADYLAQVDRLQKMGMAYRDGLLSGLLT